MPDDPTDTYATDDAAASPPATAEEAPTAAPDWQAIAARAVEALRLTREYVSPIIRLAAWPGWSWFDATNTYRQAAGIPPLEPEPVPELVAASDAPPGYSPDYTTTDRGFKHLEPVPSTYAGRVRVYESSAADGPHLWLAITQPADLNEPTGPELSARAHLTADSAEEVALQLLWLLEHHYQGASGSARATAAIRALLTGDDSAHQIPATAAPAVTAPADSELARMLADYPPPLFTGPTQPPATPTQTRLPRTAEEILAHIQGLTQHQDFFGAQMTDLVRSLPFEQAQRYLNAEVTAGEWQPLLTVEAVTAAAQEYLSFAAGKASDHRGLSAGRSIDHYRAWLWLLGKDGEVDWDNYTNYGAPILKRIAEVMGWQTAWASLSDPQLERMADGQPCTPGCEEGCAVS